MRQFRTVIPAVFAPLAAGTALYWLFRGIPVLRLAPVVSVHNAVVGLLANNVPDGLWLYALLQAIQLLWGPELHTRGRLWLWVAVTGAMGSEFAQLLHAIPGTFDFLDLLAYSLATAAFLLQYHPFTLNPNSI